MLNESTKLNLYYAQIHDNMMSKCQLDRLQRHQNKRVRLVTNGYANTETYKKLKVLNITSLIQLENYKHGYKLNNNLLPIPVARSCTSDSTHQSIITHYYTAYKYSYQHIGKGNNRPITTYFTET